MPTERPFSPALWEQIPAAVQDYIRALEAQVLPDVCPSSQPLSWDLETRRQLYAEELRAVSNLRSAALVQAFATVPREQFLGPGPWQIVAPATPGTYWTTDDADPRHLYHNVVVAIDATRHLNNGQPGFLALLIEALELQRGDRVVHIGCGLGYYTAIVAEVVGPAGLVTAVELDPTLAARAGTHLRQRPRRRRRAEDHAAAARADGSVHRRRQHLPVHWRTGSADERPVAGRLPAGHVGRRAIAPSRPTRPDRRLLAPWERFLPVHCSGTHGRMNAVASHRSVPPASPITRCQALYQMTRDAS
jgi:protein-L-isoaspartate O-methyltransferase